MAVFWATQWTASSRLRIKSDPSLNRSWCELFKTIKDHGAKNPSPRYSFGPKVDPLAKC